MRIIKILYSIIKSIIKSNFKFIGFKQYFNLKYNMITALCSSFFYVNFYLYSEQIPFTVLDVIIITILMFFQFFIWIFLFVYFILKNKEFFGKFFVYTEPISQIEIKSIYVFILYYIYFVIKAFPLFLITILIPYTLIGKILLNLILFCLYITITLF